MPSDKRALGHLENRLRDAGYELRYERGHFRAGYCVVHERKVVVVNKFFDAAARLQTLREIAGGLDAEPTAALASGSEADKPVLSPANAPSS